MKTWLLLRPGLNGTKKLVARYGDRLLAVRYRYDEVRRKRFKTEELIVDEVAWQPPEPGSRGRHRRRHDNRVGVRVEWHERELRQRLKLMAAIWWSRHELWETTYATAVHLGIIDRIESG